MKVRATVVLSFQAKTFAEAGETVDDVLGRARERGDVDVGHVEVTSPPGDGIVTLPPLPMRGAAAPPPPPRSAGNGA